MLCLINAQLQLQQHAVMSLQSAADKGSIISLLALAECYDKGIVVERDLAKARELFGRAALGGITRWIILTGSTGFTPL
jgi:TPR repeat protein